MKTIFVLLIVSFSISCSLHKQKNQQKQGYIQKSGVGDTRTKEVSLVTNNMYRLLAVTSDSTYGYSPNNPIKVGGVPQNEGPLNERRFLNALVGNNKEELGYFRVGSCCSFKTPHAFIGEIGVLDCFKVYIKGSMDTVRLYLNIYDQGDLFIPVGFKSTSL